MENVSSDRNVIIKRSGTISINLAVALTAMITWMYAVQTKDYGYAIGSCILPVVFWAIFMTRHYWSKTPRSTDGWSWALVVLTFVSGNSAAKRLKVHSPHELMEASQTKSTQLTNPAEQKIVNVMEQAREMNADMNKAEEDFDKSYGGKHLMENECFLNPQVAQVCADDTQKALDQMYRTEVKRNAMITAAGTTVGREQDAQLQAVKKFFASLVEWYRFAADPSNEVKIEEGEGHTGEGKADRFNELRSAALSAQTDFQKATKAYAAYQNEGLKKMGLSPKDFGAPTELQQTSEFPCEPGYSVSPIDRKPCKQCPPDFLPANPDGTLTPEGQRLLDNCKPMAAGR